MIRVLIAITCCAALVTGCNIRGPTKAQAQEIKTTAGTVGEFIGLPRPVGEGIAALAIAGIGAFTGHKHGRRHERKAQAKKIVTPTPAAVTA